jgi:hypothetical protein
MEEIKSKAKISRKAALSLQESAASGNAIRQGVKSLE